MMNTTNAATYLVTPNVKTLLLEADRAFYANPVRVELLYSEISTRLVFVYEPIHGRTFPTDAKNLRASWQLTKRQRATVAEAA